MTTGGPHGTKPSCHALGTLRVPRTSAQKFLVVYSAMDSFQRLTETQGCIPKGNKVQKENFQFKFGASAGPLEPVYKSQVTGSCFTADTRSSLTGDHGLVSFTWEPFLGPFTCLCLCYEQNREKKKRLGEERQPLWKNKQEWGDKEQGDLQSEERFCGRELASHVWVPFQHHTYTPCQP